MKISVDDKEIFTISETQKKVIKNDIDSTFFEEDMKRRLFDILDVKYRQCFNRLREEWEPKLIKSGAKSLPTDKEEFAKLVFSQPDYKCRMTREKEIEEKRRLEIENKLRKIESPNIP